MGVVTAAVVVAVVATVLGAGAATRRAVAARSVRTRLSVRARPVPPAPAWPTGHGRRIVAPVGVLATLAVAGPAVAALAGFAAVGGPRVARRLGAERALDRYVEAVPEALEAVGRALRAGAATRRAIAVAARGAPGALADDLADVVRRAEHGVPLATALERWATASPAPGVRLAVAALTLAGEAGGDAARSVEGVAATLRDRVGLRRELRALAAQARLSALVVAVAPLGFAAVAAAADSATARFLLTTPLGGMCLVTGVALDVGAWAWMDRITRSVT